MYELCVDSSAGASVALLRDGQVLARQSNEDSRAHAESLAPMIKRCLVEADITTPSQVPWRYLCVGTGPAPFTGLRAGIVTVATLGQTWGVPVYGVGALEALARAALDTLPSDSEVMVVTDARRKEVYWGRYKACGADEVEELSAPQVASVSDLAGYLGGSDTLVCGPAARLVAAKFPVNLGSEADVDPAIFSRIVRAGLERGRAFAIEPQYLRTPDIHGK